MHPPPVRGASQILRAQGRVRPAAGRGGTLSSPFQQRQSAKRQLELEARAHHLRQHPTASEQHLWSALRGSRLGVPFRRQVVIGCYIADFVCPHALLVVEVDGEVHARRTRLDAHRDEHLRRAGYRVLRIPAALVTRNLDAAVALIREALVA